MNPTKFIARPAPRPRLTKKRILALIHEAANELAGLGPDQESIEREEYLYDLGAELHRAGISLRSYSRKETR